MCEAGEEATLHGNVLVNRRAETSTALLRTTRSSNPLILINLPLDKDRTKMCRWDLFASLMFGCAFSVASLNKFIDEAFLSPEN